MIVDSLEGELPLDMKCTDDDVEPQALDWSTVDEIDGATALLS